jgi:hypothetical protein
MEPKLLQKLENKAKTELEARTKSPVKTDQPTVPIADALRLLEAGVLAFGIPAHNGARGPAPAVTKWLGMDAGSG